MKRFYKVVYEVEGSRKTDEVMIWADNIANAVEEFKNTEINYGNGIKLKYTEHAIKEIRK